MTADGFTPDVWHVFRVEVVGSRVTAFIDGVRVFDSEAAAMAPRGGVWLGGIHDITVQYDDASSKPIQYSICTSASAVRQTPRLQVPAIRAIRWNL